MSRVGSGKRVLQHLSKQTTEEEMQRPAAGKLSNDRLLRDHGFKIHSRPRTGPTIWHHPDGGVCTEADALAYALREIRAQGKEGESCK